MITTLVRNLAIILVLDLIYYLIRSSFILAYEAPITIQYHFILINIFLATLLESIEVSKQTNLKEKLILGLKNLAVLCLSALAASGVFMGIFYLFKNSLPGDLGGLAAIIMMALFSFLSFFVFLPLIGKFINFKSKESAEKYLYLKISILAIASIYTAGQVLQYIDS